MSHYRNADLPRWAGRGLTQAAQQGLFESIASNN